MAYSILLKKLLEGDLLDILARKISTKRNTSYGRCREELLQGDFPYAEDVSWETVVRTATALHSVDIPFRIIKMVDGKTSEVLWSPTEKHGETNRSAPDHTSILHPIEVAQNEHTRRSTTAPRSYTRESIGLILFLLLLAGGIWLIQFFWMIPLLKHRLRHRILLVLYRLWLKMAFLQRSSPKTMLMHNVCRMKLEKCAEGMVRRQRGSIWLHSHLINIILMRGMDYCTVMSSMVCMKKLSGRARPCGRFLEKMYLTWKRFFLTMVMWNILMFPGMHRA